MFQQHHHFPQGYLAVPRTQPGIWLAGNMTEECTKDFKSSDKVENYDLKLAGGLSIAQDSNFCFFVLHDRLEGFLCTIDWRVESLNFN